MTPVWMIHFRFSQYYLNSKEEYDLSYAFYSRYLIIRDVWIVYTSNIRDNIFTRDFL